jgi:hypothetical protein
MDMKKLFSALFVLAFVFIASSNEPILSNNNLGESKGSEVSKVEVYYFHATRRCVTCKALGTVSQELIENKYKDKVKFIEINIDEEGNEEIIEKFQVTGSGLYVYNGDKIVNITAYAFQYAINNPDKLKSKLIQLISRNL